MKDMSSLYVIPEWQRDAVPVWADVARPGWTYMVSSKVGEDTARKLEALEARLGGLTDSAAVRLLSVIAFNTLEAVEHYAPELFEEAIREQDAPGENALRLASMVCPLTVYGVEAVTERGSRDE